MITIMTIVWTRPQFIKASVLSKLIKEEYRDNINELLIHTGQHYDRHLSQCQFSDRHAQQSVSCMEIRIQPSPVP